jgi:hypothetical protein
MQQQLQAEVGGTRGVDQTDLGSVSLVVCAARTGHLHQVSASA